MHAVTSDDAVQHLLSLWYEDRNILTLDATGFLRNSAAVCRNHQHQHVEGIIAFWCDCPGETHHAEIIASESACIMDLQTQTGVPIIYEILFVEHIDHAKARSIGSGGKGKLAADTLLTFAQVDKFVCL